MKKKASNLLLILGIVILFFGLGIKQQKQKDGSDQTTEQERALEADELPGRGSSIGFEDGEVCTSTLNVYVNDRLYYNCRCFVSLPENCKRHGTITICSELDGVEKDLVSNCNYENSVVWIGDEYPEAIYVERINELDNNIVYDAYVEEGFYYIDLINVDGDIYISCADLMNCIELDWPEDISFVTDITDVEGITYEYDPLLEHYELLGEIKEGDTYGMPTEDMTYGAQGIATQGKVFRHKEEGYIVVGYEFKQTEIKGDKYILNQP